MSDSEDFQWVLGKVARLDSHGTERSGSYLGTGGLRQEDGKISALVYDTQAISPEEADRLTRREPLDEPLDADERQAIAAIVVGVAAVATAGVYAVRNRDQIAEQVSSRVTEPLKEKLRQLRRRDEPAPAPESRQITAPAQMPAELQGILDQTTVRRPQP
jgi:hypothetical protein